MQKNGREILAGFVREHKSEVCSAFFFAVTGSIINILIPLSIGYFQALYAGDGGGKLRILHSLGIQIDTAQGFFIFFGLLVAMRFILAWAENVTFLRIGERWSAQVRERLFGAQLAQSPMVFNRKQPGQYLLRYASDLSSTRNLVTKGLLKGSSDITMIIFAVSVFFWMDQSLGLVMLIFLGLTFPFIVLTASRTAKLHAAGGDMRSGLMRIVSDTYYGFASMKALNGERKRMGRFRKKSTQLLDQTYSSANWMALEQALTEILSFVSIGLVLFFSAQYGSVSYTNGMLLSVILVLLYMRGPLRRLLRLPSLYAKGKSSLTKVCELISLPRELPAGDELCRKELLPIRFDQLVLVEGRKPLNADIPGGAMVWITGPHGSGKTRLLECLVQVTAPCSGSIFMGTDRLESTPPFQTRRRVALVADSLFPEGKTIAEFIRSDSSEQRTLEARSWYDHFRDAFAVQAGSSSFESWSGIEVSCLSETQVRLLKIIRAFLSGKKIICIDGQFAHFSPEENQQLAHFMAAMKGKRTFVIASQSLPPGLQPDLHIQLS